MNTLRIARGFALAAACCLLASAAAVVAHIGLRATAVVAEQFPATFMLLAFVAVLYWLLHFAFVRRREH